MPEPLPPQYQPSDHEGSIYAAWETAGVFSPKPRVAGETPFSILMPPPNANGSLHVGHAVFVTLQDLMVRYHRMQGDATVWFPGLDHAGFETQVVFEKFLEKQGKSRFTMPRDEFYQATLAFTKENSSNIINQMKRLGASADWSRLKFTLDPDVVEKVHQTFVKLYDDGLAYRTARPVHWCTKHQTTLSDLEVKEEVRTDPLYYLKYGPLMVATGRPETIYGDVAVAVHPADERYQALIGTEIEVDFGSETRAIAVVADEMVDREFGTGVVKITPAHDPNDFEVAQRHDLPIDRLAIDQYGKLTELAGPFAGLKVEEARKQIVAQLTDKGLVDHVNESYQHAVKVCYKCNRTIEPRILPQWFVAVSKRGTSGKAWAPDAIKAVEAGRVKFVTERFRKLFDHWMGNIRDWNISRQIVWGIRLPVWYCQVTSDCPPIVQSPTPNGAPKQCPTCGGTTLEQDPDVFDTWFSSGQWPVIVPQTTGHPDDAERFYPTAIMETGWDIIFFWVARMLMFGLYLTDEVPFKQIYLHGMVRDKDRQKMSKSKGNVMDPLAIIDQYGTDALRLALVFNTSAGSDMPMDEEKVRGMRNFANKLWNISRFILMNVGESLATDFEAKTDADRLILKQLDETITGATHDIETFRFHEAAQRLYQFVWNDLAAVYIEASKAQLKDEATIESTKAILLYSLATSLKLLHPIMPFVTETIWQQLPGSAKDSELLAQASWPTDGAA